MVSLICPKLNGEPNTKALALGRATLYSIRRHARVAHTVKLRSLFYGDMYRINLVFLTNSIIGAIMVRCDISPIRRVADQ